MKKRSFTLLEILFTLIIMGILATIAFPTYQSFVEDAHARVCETNLRALKTALDIYAMDHDTMPAALGALPQEYLNKAYAQVMEHEDAWKTKLAYAILEWNERGLAYAYGPNFLYALAKGNIKLITCPNAQYLPMDIGGGFIPHPSYAVLDMINMTTLAYRNLAPNTILIGDSNHAVLNAAATLTPRHLHVFSRVHYSIGIQADGTIVHDPN
jgi:prepilin-type N-terminal cleavage/methylation domain-containing protein